MVKWAAELDRSDQLRHIFSYDDYGNPDLIAYVIGDESDDIDAGPGTVARLIAAAPDLLAVVKELEECAEYWCEYDVPLGIVDRIRATIARAEGRT